MGIKGLTALLHEHAPAAFKDHEIKTLFGRKVAIDASMSIYQFLIAVRQKDGELLTNDQGETTSHLMGLFYRTIRMVDHGIKPAYVFDGKPPELKSGVLAQRFERRKEATEQGEEAKEVGTVEDVDRFSRRTVKVTKEHNEECRKLLKLMGIPCIVAPSEAEAQCAELARGGNVYAAGSEDMDTLTFNSPILLRHLTFSEAKKAPISEVNLQKALVGLEMNMNQFIDLCILLGCDYLEPIKGVGPKSALKLIREYGSLDKIVKHLREKQAEREGASKVVDEEESEEEDEPAPESEDDGGSIKEEGVTDGEVQSSPPPKPAKRPKNRIESDDSDGDEQMKDVSEDEEDKKEKAPKQSAKSKGKAKATDKGSSNAKTKGKGKGKGGIQVPEHWPWKEAKQLFIHPDVTPAEKLELVWTEPDVDGLVDFLVKDKGFNEDRVRKGADKLSKMLNAKQQGRLDGFFTVKAKDPQPAAKGSKDAKSKGKAGGPSAKGTKRKADEKDGGAKKRK